MGNRIGKSYTENNQTTYTWYVRDAQGNPMATYEQKTVNNEAQLKLIELPIYGSSRLGMLQPNKLLTENSPVNSSFSIGRKQYEISNHLGNVLTTISDAKQAVDSDNDGVTNYFKPIIKTQQDYYPFGMLMPERQYEQPSGYEEVTTLQAVTNFTIYSNDYNGNVTGADKIVDQNNYPNTSSTTDNGKFKIASTQNATTSYGYFYAIEARQGTYTITFDYQATGSANRRFFVSAYNLNSQGVATDLLYPINTQNMTNGSKTFTFTYSSNGRQYLSFAFYITNHTNPLATRFFTIDNFTVKFTGNYPFTETLALYDGKEYRWGFNGKEMDNDVKGKGVQYDYGFRIYDARLGKFLSVDPLFKDFPFYTPYQFAGNKTISSLDLDGCEDIDYRIVGIDEMTGGTIVQIYQSTNTTYNSNDGQLKVHSHETGVASDRFPFSTNPGDLVGNGTLDELFKTKTFPNEAVYMNTGTDKAGDPSLYHFRLERNNALLANNNYQLGSLRDNDKVALGIERFIVFPVSPHGNTGGSVGTGTTSSSTYDPSIQLGEALGMVKNAFNMMADNSSRLLGTNRSQNQVSSINITIDSALNGNIGAALSAALGSIYPGATINITNSATPLSDGTGFSVDIVGTPETIR